jgi:hypothetical protein
LALLLAPVWGSAGENLRVWERPAYSADLESTLHPAYRVVEHLSDGVFDFTRFYMIGPLSEDAGAELRGVRDEDSFAVFERSFARRQQSLMQRSSERRKSFSLVGPANRDTDPMWAGREEAKVALAAMRDALLDRYKINNLTRWAGDYAKDPNGWRPASLAAASAVGATVLYLSGLRAGYDAGPLGFLLDVEPAHRLKAASSGTSTSAASLEVRLLNQPLKLRTDLGLSHGRLKGDSYSLNYQQRF